MPDTVTLVVPPREAQAYEIQSRVRSLHERGALELYARAVVRTDDAGRATVTDADEPALGVGAVTGGLLGTFVGVVAGPLGPAVGATTGTAVGALADALAEREAFRIIPAAAGHLGPLTTAVLVVAGESDPSVLDDLAAEFGARLERWPAEEVLAELDAAEEARDRAEREARSTAREARMQQTRDKVAADWAAARDTLRRHRVGA